MLSTVALRSLRPPLKWAGGKRWQVPHLRPLWEAHPRSRLVEPFCGGLAVTLGLLPERALLNDANPHLINFYRWLQRGLKTELRMENNERLFYRQRTGFNGLCRFNSKGEFNVPFGKYARIGYTHDFTPYKEAFRDWKFIDADFETIRLARRDFVYADPPYDVEFTTYAKGGFPWDDQVRTAAWLARHQGPVILVHQSKP